MFKKVTGALFDKVVDWVSHHIPEVSVPPSPEKQQVEVVIPLVEEPDDLEPWVHPVVTLSPKAKMMRALGEAHARAMVEQVDEPEAPLKGSLAERLLIARARPGMGK